MFKYEIENELKKLQPLALDEFKSYLDNLTLNQNRIIFFSNKSQEYYGFYCTYCKKWEFVKKKGTYRYKRGESKICVNCGNTFEVIFPNNVIYKERKYVTKIELNFRNEIVLRTFYYEKEYFKKEGLFEEQFLEVERINLDRKIAMKCNSCITMFGYGINHSEKGEWKRDRSELYKWYPFVNVVNDNLGELLKNTQFKYSAAELAVQIGIDVLDYLVTWEAYPKIELLAKAKCSHLLQSLCKPGCYPHTNISYIFNNLNKKAINMLRKYNLGYEEIVFCIKTGIEDVDYIRKGLSIKFDAKRVGYYKNAYKVIDYLFFKKYNEIDYHDYLKWCTFLGKDMENKKVLYPDDPKLAHDTILVEKKDVESEIINNSIKEYANELEKISFKSKKYMIRPAKSQMELIEESKKLHHCVRTYAESYATRETSIFFIRNLENIEESFVTLELQNSKVIQCRAKNNRVPDASVIKFVNTWCQKNSFQSCFS